MNKWFILFLVSLLASFFFGAYTTVQMESAFRMLAAVMLTVWFFTLESE